MPTADAMQHMPTACSNGQVVSVRSSRHRRRTTCNSAAFNFNSFQPRRSMRNKRRRVLCGVLLTVHLSKRFVTKLQTALHP